ncbi:DNA cytosine methyltransferase [Enterococcus sp.]|uniref:DNA cytosine methyltransferase n=1 Tax=Enterococcus TaxID=1350 RepID=UPI000A70B874|nr:MULTISPECIES: DNA (cytosine-5-)-methyltransferase [Enterococcus]MDK7765359.1 DNA (cytosine-5-)-methyltransferase [Enterococcus faecalis]MDN6562871.1 DNA cytosine methyltransferase [Enterococcus sp.]MDN6617781.1 DNA cytosine methyltransferase [Enterococcus sp.]MDN6776527.1 DNA cytosine methyltransferase [Enterococcus sp.]MDV2517177.1 DNA (cytosine-5-)-methyltransferase [Enterococcus faecalis]
MITITNLTLGSLFDGIGVFPLAAQRHGIIPLWASEIEKAPIRITKRQFPKMIHLGDLTKLHGGEIPPVDIVTFGSPCQNLSTIGNREGLAGKKSNLFYEAIRIIEEMREITNGKYPTLAIWENVMGAFSSNDRMDFKAVLEAFVQTEVPIPPSRQWANAGMVRGRNVDICWRVLDSQYWGVPQRRRRIFLVADFRDFRAREILFDTQGMQSHLETCYQNRLSATKDNRSVITETGRQLLLYPFQERRMRTYTKERNANGFISSFGQPTDPFPTLLAGTVDVFAYWQEGLETEGFVRKLTPLECERLMGLPENWTQYGMDNQLISDSARYKALGNSIVVPCAEFILSNVAKVYGKKGGSHGSNT